MAKIPSSKFRKKTSKIPSRKLPKSKTKIPSKAFPKGTAKIATRKIPHTHSAAKKRTVAPLPDRPANEEDRRDRIEELKEKLKTMDKSK
jgi:hypothetical protein